MDRFATIAESQEELRHNWPGARCPHGRPVGMMIGWDDPCGRCEQEAYDEMVWQELLDELDESGVYPNPIGPDRPGNRQDTWVRLELQERKKEPTDDIPF